MAPNRRQAIILTNADLIHWRIYATLSLWVISALLFSDTVCYVIQGERSWKYCTWCIRNAYCVFSVNYQFIIQPSDCQIASIYECKCCIYVHMYLLKHQIFIESYITKGMRTTSSKYYFILFFCSIVLLYGKVCSTVLQVSWIIIASSNRSVWLPSQNGP